MSRDAAFGIALLLGVIFITVLAFSSKDVSIGFIGFGMIAFSAILYAYTRGKGLKTRR